jgi:hypothetical protein
MKLRHTAAWVGVTAIALVTTSACGGGTAKEAVDSADTIMAALARATDRTEQVGSAEVKISTDLGTGEPIAMDGTYSWGDGLAFDVQMDTAASGMQSLQDAPTLRMLLVDGVYYYDVDPQASGPLQGKEWMSIDTSAVLGESAGQAVKGGAGAGNPADSLKGLKYASDVEDLGSETVNGRTATHYRAELDKSDMGKFQEAYGDESMLGEMTGGTTTMTMDIWVDDKDLPVRMVQEVGAMKVTMDFSKFGRTAEIAAPPAAQTGDLTDEIKNSQ